MSSTDTPKMGRPTDAERAARQAVAAARADEVRAKIDRLAATFARDSTLEKPESRIEFARALALEVVRHEDMVERDLARDLPPDVARTLPTLARNILRLAAELGLTVKQKAGGGFWGAQEPSAAPTTAPKAPKAPRRTGGAPGALKRGPGRPRKTARLEAVEPVGEDETEDEG